MLYKILERAVIRNDKGIEEKLDIFLADGKITAEEYKKLKQLLVGE